MKQSKQISIAHINIASLTAHFTDFQNTVLQNKYDIVAVSETSLKNHIPSSEVEINGYKLIRHDRVGQDRGGLALYLGTGLKFTRIDAPINNEQLWIKLRVSNLETALGVVYKQPSFSYKTFLNNFETYLCSILPTVDKVLCVGDFNIDYLNTDSSDFKLAFEIFEGLGLTQIIEEPTRITKTSLKLLDYILVSDETLIKNSGVLQASLSDHELTFCVTSIGYEKNIPLYKTTRDFKNINASQFYADLKSIPWQNIYQLNNIDKKVDFVNTNIITLLDIHAPFKTLRITKPYAPWMTDTIKAMMMDRDKILAKYKKCKRSADWHTYKQLRNMVTVTISREKKAFLQLQEGKNVNEVWAYLKQLNFSKPKNLTLPDSLSNVEQINQYFINSITKLPADNDTIEYYKENKKENIFAELSFSAVSESKVLKTISSIKSRAIGVDGIGILTINLCLPFLLPYITHLINFCLEESVFPTVWKKAKITPLPKVNNPDSLNHLRPISILPSLSKILEKIMEQQIQSHLEKYCVLPVHQSGFRKYHSCCTALTAILDDILGAIDKNKITVLILLDYSKAFDTLNHSLLLSIFNFLSFSKNAVQLMSNFLNLRSQAVFYDGKKSSFLAVSAGVPQGSVLAPLLYSLYVSDFPSAFLSCLHHYYCDDTQGYISFYPNESSQAISALNFELSNISEISKKHCLQLNSKKSGAIIFGPRRRREIFENAYRDRIVLESTPITFFKTIRNLGLIMDQDLRFTQHINKCIQRGYLNLKKIYEHRTILPKKTKTMLCESYVLSQVNYCDTVYGPCIKQSDATRIQRLQNSCLRLIHGIRKYQHISHTLKTTNWLNMYSRRYVHSATLFFKIIKNQVPKYLHRKLRFRTDVHTLNLRFRGRLTPPKHKLELFKRSFSYQIATTINKLPAKILQSKNVSIFKKQLFKFLLKQ